MESLAVLYPDVICLLIDRAVDGFELIQKSAILRIIRLTSL